MERLTIKKWGNSNGLRLPKNIMEFLGVHADDKVLVISEEVDGKRRLIIESALPDPEKEMTIEELFEDYNGEKFKTEVHELGEPMGHEKW